MKTTENRKKKGRIRLYSIQYTIYNLCNFTYIVNTLENAYLRNSMKNCMCSICLYFNTGNI